MTQATAIPAEQTLFTRERVEKSLVFVSRVLLDVVELNEDVAITRRKMERCELGLGDYNRAVLDKEYRALMERFRELVAELDLVGVELIDFEMGVVMFPTVSKHGDGVYIWSLRESGPPCLTKRELAHEYFKRTKPALKGGTDA